MADLDDFFAKRDKKKNKTKKFLSSEELVKQLEQAVKEKEQNKSKPDKIEEESSTSTTQKVENIDDEWKSVEEENKQDRRDEIMSNLKLVCLDEGSDNENNQNSNENYDNEGSQFDRENNSENPWKKANAASDATAASGPAKSEAPPPPTSNASGKYVPPSMLRQEALQKAARNKKNAPDFNESSFPSLGTEKALQDNRPVKKDGFEEVKHGGKQASASTGNAPVSIGNPYSSLLNDSLDS